MIGCYLQMYWFTTKRQANIIYEKIKHYHLGIIMLRKLIMVLFSCLLIGCSLSTDNYYALDERHESIFGNGLFNYQGNNYQDYINFYRRKLEISQLPIDTISPKKRIDGNLPFLLKPNASCGKGVSGKYKKGILLTHGLGDSPYFMKSLGNYLQSQCFVVLGLLLPGHGTRPGDLANTSWREWEKAQVFGIEQTYQFAEDVYLAGFSTGAALVLYSAAGRHDLKGMLLFSPAIKISLLAHFAKVYEVFALFSDRLKWRHIGADDDPYKYQSFHFNAIVQTNKLLKRTRRKLANLGLDIPVFMAASWEDETVNIPAAIDFFYRLSNPMNQLMLFSQKRMEFNQGSRPRIVQPTGQQLLSLSHIGLMLPPDDPVYGITGSYRECEYYLGHSAKYNLCKSGKAPFVGEVTSANVGRGVVQRISYNPWWKVMTMEVKEFLDFQ